MGRKLKLRDSGGKSLFFPSVSCHLVETEFGKGEDLGGLNEQLSRQYTIIVQRVFRPGNRTTYVSFLKHTWDNFTTNGKSARYFIFALGQRVYHICFCSEL